MRTVHCLLRLAAVFCAYISLVDCQNDQTNGFFAGRCGPMSPCGQVCEDLPNNGFLCSCKPGFRLHDNGFSCLEIIPNPATTLRPELYDLDATEKELPGSDKNSAEALEDLSTDTEGEARKEADVAESLEELKWSGLDTSEDEDEEDNEMDDEEAYLDSLTKRGGNRGDGNRNRGSRRGKGRGKNRKGKGRKGNKASSINKSNNMPKYQMDLEQPLNDVYVKEGKVGKDKSAENEVEAPSRHMSCLDLFCKGGGRCVPDELRAGGGVRCQCPLGKEGQFCERDIVVQFPKFMGTGYMAFPVLRGAYRDMSITIEFKPDVDNGLLLYSGDFPHPMSDFFSVALVDAHVEFRFDCGTGMAQIKTHNTIERGQWNTVTIKRSDWYGWLQLNDGAQERGRSVGLFSRITFREDLYLGGYKNTSQLGGKTGMQWGFVGCVRFLQINSETYDMRQGAFVGDAIHGVDVGECSSNVCDAVKCQNGGTCVAESADTSVCLCPLGTAGDRCESRIDIHVPEFSGSSYLKYLGLGQSVLSYLDGELVFKAQEPTGLLLYNGYATDRTGDFLSLALANGFVDFRFDLGTGPAVIRSREPVSMNEWHVVKFKRTGRNGELTVDSQAPVTGLSKGGYTQLTLTLDLFVGGHRNFDEVAKKAQIRAAFKGCIQKVVVSDRPLRLVEDALAGVNIDNCQHPCKGQPCMNGGRCVPIREYYRCSCPVGFENSNCEDRVVRYRYRYRYRRDIQEPITTPMFSGTSYLVYREDPREQTQYRDPDRQMRTKLNGEKADIQLRLRTDRPEGVLMWVGESRVTPSSDYLGLGLSGGHVRFVYNLGSGQVTIIDSNTRVDDGKWHKIQAQRFGQVGYLTVDGNDAVEGKSPGNLRQFYVQNPIYIGGLPNVAAMTDNKFTTGFDGCISNVTLGLDYHVDLPGPPTDIVNIRQCMTSQ